MLGFEGGDAGGIPAMESPAAPAFGREDVLRAQDRLRVLQSRAGGRWLKLLWLLAGPGVLVMIGENDGPSMVSYATTGASYGIGFFIPFILLTFVMAYVVQEMAVRLGVATHRGHAELIFQRFGPFWGYFAMADLVVGNLLTLVTEFIAIQAGGLVFRRAGLDFGRRWALPIMAGALGLAALRDVGADIDGAGRVQPGIHSGGAARPSQRCGAGAGFGGMAAAAWAYGDGVRDADPGEYRGHGDALDDFLPAKCGGG